MSAEDATTAVTEKPVSTSAPKSGSKPASAQTPASSAAKKDKTTKAASTTSKSFSVDDIVLARLKGYPPWREWGHFHRVR